MNDKKSQTGELTFDELEKVTGGEVARDGGGISKPVNQPSLPMDRGEHDRATLGGLGGFASGAAGGGGKPPS